MSPFFNPPNEIMDPGKDHFARYHKERERQGHEILLMEGRRTQEVIFAKHLKLKQLSHRS